MKIKTTAKAIRNSYETKVALGYCEASHLFRNHEPIAYTCGVYGWNFDVYQFGNVLVSTGYRGMVGSRPAVPVTEYECKAKAIAGDYSKPYEARQEAIESLLREWLNQL